MANDHATLDRAVRKGEVKALRRGECESKLPDGGRQIVIATDKPMSSFAQGASGTTYDAAFTLLEFRFPAGSAKGEGKLQLEAYTNQPTQLTQVTEINPKVKK